MYSAKSPRNTIHTSVAINKLCVSLSIPFEILPSTMHNYKAKGYYHCNKVPSHCSISDTYGPFLQWEIINFRSQNK